MKARKNYLVEENYVFFSRELSKKKNRVYVEK